MNKFNELVSGLFGWTSDAAGETSVDDDDEDDGKLSQKSETNTIAVMYAKKMMADEHFVLDSGKNVVFIIADSAEWSKPDNYAVDGGIRLYSHIPFKEFARQAFCHEITHSKTEFGVCSHESVSENCVVSQQPSISKEKLLFSKKYVVLAVVLHDDPVSTIVEDITLSKKPNFRKGVVFSEVVDGLRRVSLCRPIDKQRDLFTHVAIGLKTRSSLTEAQIVSVISDEQIVAELKTEAKKHAVESASKLTKIKL